MILRHFWVLEAKIGLKQQSLDIGLFDIELTFMHPLYYNVLSFKIPPTYLRAQLLWHIS